MEKFRYGLMVLIWVSMPPALVWWFIVHPFVGFWRRVGTRGTFTVIIVGSVLMGWGMWEARHLFEAGDLGTRWPLVGIGAALVVAAGILSWYRRKQLTNKILMGLPEIDPEKHQRKLLTEGVYARVRHPRYMEVILALLGYVLVANFAAGYLVWVLTVVALYLIVLLEERELAAFFGEEYAAYRRRVPMFIPRLGR